MDIEIFPYRLLSTETTEKVLKEVSRIDGVKRIVLHGQRIDPEQLKSTPEIKSMSGESTYLHVQTGRILMEIESKKVIASLREIFDSYFPFGYEIGFGKFIRKQKTVSDSLKYGKNLDNVPKELVGLTDQNVKLSDRTSVIRKEQ